MLVLPVFLIFQLGGREITGKNRSTARSGTYFLTSKIYPDAKQDCSGIIVDRVEEIAKKYGVTNARIALTWHFTKPYIVSAIVSVSKSE